MTTKKHSRGRRGRSAGVEVASPAYHVVGLPARDRHPAVPYGYSTSVEEAHAALERGRRRGVTWAGIWTRTSPVRGMRAGEWLTPFDDRKAGFR